MTAEEEIRKIKEDLELRRKANMKFAEDEAGHNRELSNVFRQISYAFGDALREIEEMERWN